MLIDVLLRIDGRSVDLALSRDLDTHVGELFSDKLLNRLPVGMRLDEDERALHGSSATIGLAGRWLGVGLARCQL
jgi:hypothetical protein